MDDSKIRSEQADRLMKAVLTLETVEDAYRFFEDLCTIAESTPWPSASPWRPCCGTV